MSWKRMRDSSRALEASPRSTAASIVAMIVLRRDLAE